MNIAKSVGLLAAFAIAAAFASDAAAQASPETNHPGAIRTAAEPPRNLPDMRLWSFGDCDEKFPYVNTVDHKECVRVVGSEEARDARAYRVCETSNARDPEGIAQCKSTYKANKERSAQSGYVPDKAAQMQQAAPTAEDLQRVRAIASAAVENDKAAAAGDAAQVSAAATAPSAQQEIVPEEPEGPPILTIVLSLLAAGGGTYAFLQRRRAANVLSTR